VERLCRRAALRIWAALPGVLVGKAHVILYVPSQGINSEGKFHGAALQSKMQSNGSILSLLSRHEGKTLEFKRDLSSPEGAF
jgi:hypothetical protein